MSDWTKLGTSYVSYGFAIRGRVWQDGEIWRHSVFVDGDGEVSKGEWPDRETAIQEGGSGMSRACFLRRFEKDSPVLPGEDDTEDDDYDGFDED